MLRALFLSLVLWALAACASAAPALPLHPAWFPHGSAGGGGGACSIYNGIGSADGCSGAQGNGLIVDAHFADAQTVFELALVPGSGYANGTCNWTTTGGGGSGAAGTITVSGGVYSSYTISNRGSLYTSRPTISITSGCGGGSGGSITPAIEQSTPHNVATTYNLPGVDYGISYQQSLSLVVPTSGNIPACMSQVNSQWYQIVSTPCDVHGFDFTNIRLQTATGGAPIGTQCSGGDTNCIKVHNNKFVLGTNPYLEELMEDGGNNCDMLVENNEFTDNATLGTQAAITADFDINSCTNGQVTYEYNWCHEEIVKCINGIGTASTGTLTVYEEFNGFRNVSMNQQGAHGEAEYYYGNSGTSTLVPIAEFNVYYDQWDMMQGGTGSCGGAGQNCETSLNASAHNDGPFTVSGVVDDYNYVIAPGPYAQTGGNNSGSSGITGSADFFVGGASNGEIKSNFMDYSGKYFPFNGSLSPYTVSGNVNAGAGGSCNTNAGC